MALDFANTHRVSHTTTNMTSFTKVSVLVWVKPDTLSGTNVSLLMFNTSNQSRPQLTIGESTDEITFRWRRATQNTVYRSNNANLVNGTWYYIAATIDQAGSAGALAKIYMGTLTSNAVELTYGTTQDGSGTFDTSGTTLYAGDGVGDNTGADCKIAVVGCIPGTVLTLGQIKDWQFHPTVLSGMRLFTHYGFNGTSTQPDWSGNGNSGTVTSATYTAHPPLGPVFGFDTSLDLNVASAIRHRLMMMGVGA